MDLLSRREHSRLELQQKLSRRFPGCSEQIAGEIDRLGHENLQSDARLAEAFIRARAGKGRGPVRIRKELIDKGVAGETISLALAESGMDWRELARAAAGKKFGAAFGAFRDLREKARVARFLQQRGFDQEHIAMICRAPDDC